jgi:site-specific recombinase XerD
MRLSKAIEGYRLVSLAEGYSPRTMEGYDWSLAHLARFFENCGMDNPELEDISPAHLRDFFLHLRPETDLAPSSIRSVWRTIRSFYNWASRDLGVERPDRNLPMPQAGNKAIVPFREEEVKALLKACEYTSPTSTIRRRAFNMRRRRRRADHPG